MAEPKQKRLKGSLPICPWHPSNPGSRVRQNLPLEVEGGLCGATSALLRLSYNFQALAEVFDRDDVALRRFSEFFHKQAKQEEEAAESLLKHMAERGGLYCSKTIEKPNCDHVCDVMTACCIALEQWKATLGYFEELYNISVDCSDPHTAGVIKKHFVEPKIRKVKLMGDLLTNTRRLNCTHNGQGNFGEYLIDKLQEELSE